MSSTGEMSLLCSQKLMGGDLIRSGSSPIPSSEFISGKPRERSCEERDFLLRMDLSLLLLALR